MFGRKNGKIIYDRQLSRALIFYSSAIEKRDRQPFLAGFNGLFFL